VAQSRWIGDNRPMRCTLLMLLAAVLLSSCGPKNPDPILPPPERAPARGTFDPSSGCQKALDHVIELALQATGSGPTNAQRSNVVSRCVETASERASACVQQLPRLPGRRGGAVGLGPVWACLGRR